MSKKRRVEKAEQAAGGDGPPSAIIVTWNQDGSIDPDQMLTLSNGERMTHQEYVEKYFDGDITQINVRWVEWDDKDSLDIYD